MIRQRMVDLIDVLATGGVSCSKAPPPDRTAATPRDRSIRFHAEDMFSNSLKRQIHCNLRHCVGATRHGFTTRHEEQLRL
jgi:hypothetical protein